MGLDSRSVSPGFGGRWRVIRHWRWPSKLRNVKNRRELIVQLKTLEQDLGIRIHDPRIFVQALKHRSYLSVFNESRMASYERMEFLGDLVLSLVTGDYLYTKFTVQEEGDLTKNKSALVNKKILASKAEALRLGGFILMSEGEERSGGRQRASILSDVLESIIGAIYLDSGFHEARRFILRSVLNNVDGILSDEQHFNYKGELLEWAQARDLGMPVYTVLQEVGPEHNKEFTIQVSIRQQLYGIGKGPSKKEAEQLAAKSTLKEIKN
ncbi:MAG: ribonuclease III [Bacteroidetes bacterium]|nr:ribonuclease III [Bacteroidota bacterium]